jgi:hypothetical protein
METEGSLLAYLPLHSVLNEFDLVNILTSCFFAIHFNIMISCTPSLTSLFVVSWPVDCFGKQMFHRTKFVDVCEL